MYVTNYRGDVISIVDQAGAEVANYSYDPWGRVLSKIESGAVQGQPIGYASYVYDNETSLYYLQARYYNPLTGNFLSLDPDSGDLDDPLSQNVYSYVNGNPVSNVDPDGEWAIDVAFMIIDGKAFIKNPTFLGAAFIAFDILSLADPSGLASLLAHGGKIKNISKVANKIKNALRGKKNSKFTLKLDLQFFASKQDIKQIQSIAKEFKMSSNKRREFGDYVESLKKHKRNHVNFSYKELKKIAREFLEG